MAFSYSWPAEKQKKQNERLFIDYLKSYIFPYSPYYRKRYRELGIAPGDIRTAADIRRLPLTKKTEMKDVLEFVLQPKIPGRDALYDTAPLRKTDMLRYVWQALRTPPLPAAGDEMRSLKHRVKEAAKKEWFPIHVHASGGTTGDPSSSLYTWHDVFKATPNISIMAYLCGLDTDFKCLNLFPAAPHLAFFQVVFSQFQLGGNVFHTCGGHIVPTERQIMISERAKFDYVVAIPSYLTYWLDVAKKMQEEGRVGALDSFKYAVVAAEPIVPAYRERLKNQFEAIGSGGCKIIEGYGMTEMKGAFYGCGEGSDIHLNAERYYWEVLDPETDEPVPEGEPGVLTFSHIGFRGTALVRYYTGDLISGFTWDRCPHCGTIGPRLKTPLCRAVKDFSKIKGARVNMLTLQTQIRSTPGVQTFRVVITKEKKDDPFSRDRVVVYIALKDGADPREVERNVKKNVKLECEITPGEVVFQSAEEIEDKLFERTGLKADWIIDERQQIEINTSGAAGPAG